MDPDIQKAIENKWLFDTTEEAHAIVFETWKLPKVTSVTCDGKTGDVMFFSWCSGVSPEVRSVGHKFQVCILVFLSRQPEKPVEPANPYGLSLVFQHATFVAL